MPKTSSPTPPGTLEGTVQRVLESGRLGTPCAVRWLVRHDGGALAAEQEMAAAERALVAWFGYRPARAHSAGDASTGHAAKTLIWSKGQTAVIAVTPGGSGRADDLVVLGSRGALYYETPALHGGLAPASKSNSAPVRHRGRAR
jgi:hypothetical protein